MTATPGNGLEERAAGPERRVSEPRCRGQVPDAAGDGAVPRDKKSMVGAHRRDLLLRGRHPGPILVALGVLEPFTIHQDRINDNGLPIGEIGGASRGTHPLGVEPGIGATC